VIASYDEIASLGPGNPKGFALWCWAYLGWVPHHKQEAFGASEARSLYYICGIRHGKSDAAAARFLYRMFYGAGHRYINAALTQDQANIVVERAHQLALSGPLAGYVDRYIKSPFPTLILKNDARLQGRTVDDPNLLRGRPYNGAGVDEGSFAKEEAVRLLRGRTLDFDGWVAIYTTPNGKGSWLHSAYLKAFWEHEHGNPKFFAATGTTWDNPHIPREALEELKAECEREGRDRWYRQEVLGEFVDMEGATFPASVLERVFRTGLVAETSPIRNEIYVTGWDVGRKTTRTCGLTLGCARDPLRGVALRTIRPGNWDWNIVYRAIDETARQWGAHTIIDGTGVGDSVPSNVSVIVEPFLFTKRSRGDLITELQSVCHRENGLALPVEWNDLRTQMMLHTWDEDAEGQTWDELDALMLAVHHARAITFRGPILTRLA
jgi:hypothetical protein